MRKSESSPSSLSALREIGRQSREAADRARERGRGEGRGKERERRLKDTTLIGHLLNVPKSESPRCCLCVDEKEGTCLRDTLVGTSCAKACGARSAWRDEGGSSDSRLGATKRPHFLKRTVHKLLRDETVVRKNKVDMSCELLLSVVQLGFEAAAAKFYHTIYPIRQTVESAVAFGEDVASTESRLSAKWHEHVVRVLKAEADRFPLEVVAGASAGNGEAALGERVPALCADLDGRVAFISALRAKIRALRDDLHVTDSVEGEDDVEQSEDVGRLEAEVFALLQQKHDRQQRMVDILHSKIRQLHAEKGTTGPPALSRDVSNENIMLLYHEVFRLLRDTN